MVQALKMYRGGGIFALSERKARSHTRLSAFSFACNFETA
jgi:hypothetical protein